VDAVPPNAVEIDERLMFGIVSHRVSRSERELMVVSERDLRRRAMRQRPTSSKIVLEDPDLVPRATRHPQPPAPFLPVPAPASSLLDEGVPASTLGVPPLGFEDPWPASLLARPASTPVLLLDPVPPMDPPVPPLVGGPLSFVAAPLSLPASVPPSDALPPASSPLPGFPPPDWTTHAGVAPPLDT